MNYIAHFFNPSPLRRTVDILNDDSPIGSQGVSEYCRFLQTAYPGFSHLEQLLFQVVSVEELVTVLEDKPGIIHIPMILEKLWPFTRDHIVVVTLDRNTRTLDYYDPQGTPFEDQTRRVLGVNLPANQFLQELMEGLDNQSWHTRSNTTQHQNDYHNCGVHVCWYLSARQSGKTFQEIITSNGADPFLFRQHMVAVLK